MNAVKYLVPALVLAVLSGCASYPISKGVRQQAQQVTFGQVRADPQGTSGTVVIWGGRIMSVDNDTNGAVIYIFCLPVNSSGRPVANGTSPGRFIASSTGFLDPIMYPVGSLITVAGQLDGVLIQQYESAEYTYPVVNILETHIWPQPQRRPSSSANWNVYWGPWGPSWGVSWGQPGWGSPWGPAWGQPAWYGPGFRGGVRIHGGVHGRVTPGPRGRGRRW